MHGSQAFLDLPNGGPVPVGRPAATGQGLGKVPDGSAGQPGPGKPVRAPKPTPGDGLAGNIRRVTRVIRPMVVQRIVRFLVHILSPLCRQPGDFSHPQSALLMLHSHDRFVGPVKVQRKRGYLLAEPLQGVAYNPPWAWDSTSKTLRHPGHSTCMRSEP
jgi:hypothetical protein